MKERMSGVENAGGWVMEREENNIDANSTQRTVYLEFPYERNAKDTRIDSKMHRSKWHLEWKSRPAVGGVVYGIAETVIFFTNFGIPYNFWRNSNEFFSETVCMISFRKCTVGEKKMSLLCLAVTLRHMNRFWLFLVEMLLRKSTQPKDALFLI